MHVILKHIISSTLVIFGTSAIEEDAHFDPYNDFYIPEHPYFHDTTKEKTFLDKTMMLKDIFEGPRLKLILAPSQFAKTSNMAMIRQFAALQLKEKDPRRQLEIEEGEITKVFKKLAIYNQTEFFKRHYAQYPVVYLNLRPDNIFANLEDQPGAQQTYSRKIHFAFRAHRYLILSKKLHALQKKVCILWNGRRTYVRFNDVEVANGISWLMEYLFIHFNKKVFLIIDEYDTLIRLCLFNSKNPYKFSLIVKWAIGLISSLLNDRHVAYAVVTGVMNIHGLPTHDDFKVYRFLDNHPFTDFFGFTDNEVDKLFKEPRLGLSRLGNRLTAGRLWYDGYVAKSGRRIYCPYAIKRFVLDGKLKTRFKDAGYLWETPEMFKDPTVLGILKELLAFKTIEVDIVDPLTIEHLLELMDMYQTREIVKNTNLFFSHFLQGGYLTYAPGFTHNNRTILRIPNLEIEEYLIQEIINKVKLDTHHLDHYIYSLGVEIKRNFNNNTKLKQFVKEHYEANVLPGFYFKLVSALFYKFNVTMSKIETNKLS